MNLSFKLLYIIVLSFLLLGFSLFEVPNPMNILKKNIPQDLLLYAPAITLDKPLITSQKQQEFCQDYLNTYFSPWNNETLLYSNNTVQSAAKKIADKFKLHPGVAENQQPHTDAWIAAAIQNMHLSTYPNTSRFAITIRTTHLRALPIAEPIFESWNKPGEGYPFDKLAVSLLPANLPIKVVQTSEDNAWALVLTSYKAFGWVPINDCAYVDKDFIRHWQTGHYAAALKDKVSVMGEKQQFLFFTRVGSIYPVINENLKEYRILVAVANAQREAVFQEASLPKGVVAILPFPLTRRNISNVANVMLGQPYDWGGAYGARDCSSTLMDLFATFGIWLPRNSADQSHTGTFISLEHLKHEAEKKAFIEKYAVPFTTILWKPGHVVLYLGQREGKQYVYQTMWGLHTRRWFESEEGRLVVGKTVITPIDFGKDFPVNISTFLSEVQGMTLLVKGDPSALQKSFSPFKKLSPNKRGVVA